MFTNSLSHTKTHTLSKTHTHTQTHALSLKHLRAPRSGMWGISNDIQTHAHPHNIQTHAHPLNMPHIAVCEAHQRDMWGTSKGHIKQTHAHPHKVFVWSSLCAPLCVLLSSRPIPTLCVLLFVCSSLCAPLFVCSSRPIPTLPRKQ